VTLTVPGAVLRRARQRERELCDAAHAAQLQTLQLRGGEEFRATVLADPGAAVAW
jgi:hypothetical protein